MHFMLERKKPLLHNRVSCLQGGVGGAGLSMQKGREVGNSTFSAPHREVHW